MNDCIFCKIVKGDIPCKKIYEDDQVLAFLDIACDHLGHTLVVPKQHCNNLLDCPADTLVAVTKAVQTISKHYVEHCGFGGVNILNNSGVDAQQEVMHLHMHILPRVKGDGYDIVPKPKQDMDLDAIWNKLKML